MNHTEPTLIRGGVVIDDRGELRFCNDFDFAGVKRFYAVQNHSKGFVRAWHGHKREAKYVMCTRGAFLFAAVKIDDWDKPSRALDVSRWVLSERMSSVLWIPPGYANGNMSLTDDAQAMYFSTATLQQSADDDIRFDARFWDPWRVQER